MPGSAGKGFILETGQAVLWSVDRDGLPWHAHRSAELTGSDHAYSSPVTIAPSGAYCAAGMLTTRGPGPDGGEHLLAAAHPRLHMVETAAEIIEATLTSYAHADALLQTQRLRDAAEKTRGLPEDIRSLLAGLTGSEEQIYHERLPYERQREQREALRTAQAERGFRGIYETIDIVFGTLTWQGADHVLIDETYAPLIRGLFPETCHPRVSRATRVAVHYDRDNVWGPSAITLTLRVPVGGRRVRRAVAEYVARQLGKAGALLVHYPGTLMPENLERAAIARADRLRAAREQARQPDPGQAEAVLEVLRSAPVSPGSARAFTSEATLSERTGMTRAEVSLTVGHLGEQGLVYSGGFSSRSAGSYWTMST